MGVVALATYSHGCEGRSTSQEPLEQSDLRMWLRRAEPEPQNVKTLQDLSTLCLQGAFLLRIGGQRSPWLKCFFL